MFPDLGANTWIGVGWHSGEYHPSLWVRPARRMSFGAAVLVVAGEALLPITLRETPEASSDDSPRLSTVVRGVRGQLVLPGVPLVLRVQPVVHDEQQLALLFHVEHALIDTSEAPVAPLGLLLGREGLGQGRLPSIPLDDGRRHIVGGGGHVSLLRAGASSVLSVLSP